MSLETITWTKYKKYDEKQRNIWIENLNKETVKHKLKRTKGWKPMYANQVSDCYGFKENFDKLEEELKMFLPQEWAREIKRISDTEIEIFYLNNIFLIKDVFMNDLMNQKTIKYGKWKKDIGNNVVIIAQFNEIYEEKSKDSIDVLCKYDTVNHLSQPIVIFDNNYISNNLAISLGSLVFKNLEKFQINFEKSN